MADDNCAVGKVDELPFPYDVRIQGKAFIAWMTVMGNVKKEKMLLHFRGVIANNQKCKEQMGMQDMASC